MEYRFINAFPISINSMPVSYDQSDLLKCTVSFTYSRYVISGSENIVEPRESLTLERPNGDQNVLNNIDPNRPLQAQLAEQLEAQGGRSSEFGSNILR